MAGSTLKADFGLAGWMCACANVNMHELKYECDSYACANVNMHELKYECDSLWVFGWKVHTVKSWHGFDWTTAMKTVIFADSSQSSPVPCCHNDEAKAC